MPRDPAADAEKAAKMAAAVREFLELKEINPHLTMAEVARDHGVNQNTMRAHVRKGAGLALNGAEEARLAGYAIGLYESGGICSRKALLEHAHAIQEEKNPYADPVLARWIPGFLDRHPDIELRPTPRYYKHLDPQGTFDDYRKLWEELASTSLEHKILDASQVWYLHETPFFWDYDGNDNILGSMKRYADDVCDLFEDERYPITTLVAYSAAGDLLLPMLLFEEVELHEGGFQYGNQCIMGRGSNSGLRDADASVEWLEMFNVFSKKYVKPDQYRMICMDASSDMSMEFVQYAIKNKILIRDLRNYSPIHDYLSQPAEFHVFSEMRKLYHATKDPSLVDEEEQNITRSGFYRSFSKNWKMEFADNDICRRAFREAGIFPLDMSKNETVMALKPEPIISSNSEPSTFDIADLKESSVLQPKDMNKLIDERLGKLTADATGSQPVADHCDYLLLHHARKRLQQQSTRIGHLRKELAHLKAARDKENVAPSDGNEDEASPASEETPRATPLQENKRPAPQAQSPEKRRKLDA